MIRKEYFNYATLIASGVLLFFIFFFEYAVMRNTSGVVMYPLDDAFIHMELAKNLSQNGVWGINRFEFGSASSSLLYTILLAVFFKIFTVNTIIPLLINIVSGLILIFAIDLWMRKLHLTLLVRLVSLMCLIFFVPLPVMIISGMEHTLQCLFSFLFIYNFSSWVQNKEENNLKKWKIPNTLLTYSILLCSIRYESVFIVAIACLYLLLRRKLVSSIKLGFFALLPIALFGFYSVLKGSYFLPNSVLLKTEKFVGLVAFVKDLFLEKLTIISSISGLPSDKPGISLLATQFLLIIIPILYFINQKRIPVNKAFQLILILLMGTAFFHLAFASTGWFYRYEAYLFCSIIPIAVVVLHKVVLNKSENQVTSGISIVIGLLFFTFLCLPSFVRSITAISKAKQACINIYDQQYQMGSFVANYYRTSPVAMNDIGVVSFKSEAKNIDLWGLGSIEVAKMRKEGNHTATFFDSLCKENNVEFAMVYDSWFPDSLLTKWRKTATWQISNNVICGDDIVSFYVLDSTKYYSLQKNLIKFAPSLPSTVKIEYY